eukprot:4379862-Alexandrium_andersonii.AAC.1
MGAAGVCCRCARSRTHVRSHAESGEPRRAPESWAVGSTAVLQPSPSEPAGAALLKRGAAAAVPS